MKTRELDECPDSVWLPYMVGNDVPIVPRGEPHPVDAGVYFLFTEDKGLFYIGLSLNADGRGSVEIVKDIALARGLL